MINYATKIEAVSLNQIDGILPPKFANANKKFCFCVKEILRIGFLWTDNQSKLIILYSRNIATKTMGTHMPLCNEEMKIDRTTTKS